MSHHPKRKVVSKRYSSLESDLALPPQTDFHWAIPRGHDSDGVNDDDLNADDDDGNGFGDDGDAEHACSWLEAAPHHHHLSSG